MAGQGQIYTFSDSTTTKRTIADIVRMIDPQDTPCISYFGTNNASKFRLQNQSNHSYEWLEDTLRVRTTTLNDAGDDGSTTDLTLTDSSIFKVGDVMLIDSEKIWIGANNTSTNNVSSLVRGWGSTSGATHANGATVTYLFSARLEGAESDASYWTVPTAPLNYSQIMQWEIKVSGSEAEAVNRYGISDQYLYQLKKALGGAGGGNGRQGRAGDLMIDLEKTFFYGEKIQRTSTVAGSMGGVDTFVTTNLTTLSGSPLLDQDTLEDSIETCWTAGGKPDVIICNSFNKRLISSWYANSVRTDRSESTGGVVINKIETEFGNLDLMLNRWCPANKVYILQRDLLGWITLRNWTVEPLAKTGDYRRDQIIGEFGFVLANETAHAIISGTATSA